MEKRLKSRHNPGLWLRIGGTLLTLALLVGLLSRQGWGDIASAIRQIPLWRFVLATLLVIMSRTAVSGRWHVLLRSAGLRISFFDSLRLTYSGLFASNFLPTTIGGDVVRLAGAIQLKFDASISAASLVVDRLVGMAGMALALPFGISGLITAKSVTAASISNTPYPWLVLSFFSQDGWKNRIKQKAIRLWSKFIGAFSDWLNHPRALLKALTFTIVHMVCLFSSIMLLLHGMGETISFWKIAGLWSFVYFITLIPISINGYGLQEVSMTLIYSNLGGISPQSSLTIALLVRTLAMFASLPGAIFVPGILEARARQKEKLAEDFPVIAPD